MKVISRSQAKMAGLKRYFTGKPCVHNHIVERFVSSGGCSKCTMKRSLEWHQKNPEGSKESYKRHRQKFSIKRSANCREWREKNRKRVAAYSSGWARNNPDKVIPRIKKWKENNREKVAGYYLQGPQNPNGEGQWLKKKQSDVAKHQTIVTKRETPRSLAIAQEGISTGQQFAALMSALMSDLVMGAITPENSNAICNASGKLLKVTEMHHKYGKGTGASLKLVG